MTASFEHNLLTCCETVVGSVGQAVVQQAPVGVMTLPVQAALEAASQKCPCSHEIHSSYCIHHSLTHVTGPEHNITVNIVQNDTYQSTLEKESTLTILP